MNHLKYFEKLEDKTHSVTIEKLFWIAACKENQNFRDFFEYIDRLDLHDCLPEIADDDGVDDYDSGLPHADIFDLFYEHIKLGFLAELSHPKCNNFTYNEKGEVISASIHRGITYSSYVYAETIDDLMKNIIAASDKMYLLFIEEDKAAKK